MHGGYRLEVLFDRLGRRVLHLSRKRGTTIGRGTECDVHLGDRTVARLHAAVWERGGEVWVEDLSTTSGTFVNHEALTGLRRLGVDDLIAVGASSLRLIWVFPVDQLWLGRDGGDLVRLARALREEGLYGELPILGDAMEEVGCRDEVVLRHCRRAGRHLAGCCVVEQLLGVAGFERDEES